MKIESNMPIPHAGGRPRAYPWYEMEIGQSFMVNCPDVESKRLANNLTSCKCNAAKKTGFKYTMRKVKGGIRCWRVS